MVVGDLVEKFIEHSCLHTLLALSMDSESMIQDELDTLPFDRLSEYNWRIREKVELLRQIHHISVEDGIGIHTWLREDLIPLIQDEDDTLFCL